MMARMKIPARMDEKKRYKTLPYRASVILRRVGSTAQAL
jgi:hypothetical protein